MPNLSPRFICPICQSPLHVGAKTWQCQPPQANSDATPVKQHSFDVAKQGYVNLLPVQHKKSKSPGDSDESIAARQRFLGAGHYGMLQQGLMDFCQAIVPQPVNTWLDIGCGEGYYSARLSTLAAQSFIALDISKPAVVSTAKRLKTVTAPTCFTMVASASQVPLASHSVDVISTIFSPILPHEFDRLLTEQGKVIIAKPGVDHLLELRAALFDRVQAHDSDKFIEAMAPAFALVKEHHIHGHIQVTPDALHGLLTMTPYSYRAKPDNRDALLARCRNFGTLTLTVAFNLYAFAKSTALTG